MARTGPQTQTGKIRLLGRNRAALEQFAAGRGQPPYRGRQLARWIYARGACDFASMTDLPALWRAQLDEEAEVGRATVARTQRSRDGTAKLLLELQDGQRVETVLLPYEDRTSVCISTQVGCPVGCTFCATATMGLIRNLDAGEIVEQVLAGREHAPSRSGPSVTHVVVMGMGEPLLNYEPLVAAVRLLHDEMGLSYRHLTVSTAGYIPGILQLAEEGLPITLALSLHAPDDALRAELIPMARRYPVQELMDAMQEYTRKTSRRVSLEYLLLADVNDTEPHARALARLLRGTITHVNLIPWNPVASFSQFQAPSSARVRRFRQVLERAGIAVTQRAERGQDIDAACGQLVIKEGVRREAPPIPINTLAGSHV
ncbi:MAG: 23S rRNA (adenine(2503)-C(2))-methyltransferase RlmN [Armatimonadetes bacterium]|nr:23S rRNA (adenine(2503)-C(2))-methyltransferase RlmN [Armatimonadota bacterium]